MESAVLASVVGGCVGLTEFARRMEGLVSPHQQRAKARKPADQERYNATLLAFSAMLARYALMPFQARHGFGLTFRNEAYVGSGLSVTALREIRDGAEKAGLISVRRGFFDKEQGKGMVTRFYPTVAAQSLARLCGLTPAMLVQPPTTTTILNDADAVEVMPERVMAEDAIVRRFNERIGEADIQLTSQAVEQAKARIREGVLEGKDFDLNGYDPGKVYLVRIFKGSWQRGGRLYGPSWQKLPAEVRLGLLIDGEPVVELDYRAMQPSMLYAEKGLVLDFDPYLVPGHEVSRDVGKTQFHRLINNSGKEKVAGFLRFDADAKRCFISKEDFQRYVADMIELHAFIADQFFTDVSMRMQSLDGSLALRVIDRSLSEGIMPLPIHDSFIVQARHHDRVAEIMRSEYHNQFGLRIGIHCNCCNGN